MGAGHAHALHVHGHTWAHRAAPEVKIVATVVFLVAVVATDPGRPWLYVVPVLALAAAATHARISPSFIARRLLVVAPFLAFAVAMPFIADGTPANVPFDLPWGLTLSTTGLASARTIIARACLGATASILLAATTQPTDIMVGLDRLRVPSTLTSIALFMLRYLETVAGELERTRTAMASRGHDPRWLWQARPIAAASGALFIRSYERGERVHQAMQSRAFTGRMPRHRAGADSLGDWARGLALPVCVVLAAVIGRLA